MYKQLTVLILVVTSFINVNAQEATHWRGVNLDAKYDVPNLLTQWPESGPEVLWSFEELGEGHASPVFANGKIYCTGMVDNQGTLFIFNENGDLEKKYIYAKEWEVNYPGTRSAPTIVGDLAYFYTGHGQVVCMSLNDGSQLWSKNLGDFEAKNLMFGVNESLVVDGEKIYFTAGGPEQNMVALNRFNGEIIWSAQAKGQPSAYCTPLLVNLPTRKLLVTHTGDQIVGIDADQGKMLWSYPHPNQYNIHPNTPLYEDQAVFCFSGYGQGGVRLNLNADGSAIEKAWSTELLDNQMGGAMIVDGYLYGSGHNNRGWHCLDWKTGEEKFKSTELANGVIIMAADKFIIYSDRGELALVNPNPEKLDIISETKVKFGSAQHWSHPIIANGVLYLRHGNALVAYKISA
ncbi:outer membrane protein assembly factor BamB family protein [Sunxiuqinia sp. A32]|uniref:outer membrane protein assembly factor BamB family protein n=1 Tax=Sunxiuqinia sp. A32 TaxID=3461496 RepID=UPI004046333F